MRPSSCEGFTLERERESRDWGEIKGRQVF